MHYVLTKDSPKRAREGTDVTQGEAVALLLTGAKSCRAEYAITEAMDRAVTAVRERRGVSRSEALRLLTAYGAVAMGVAEA